MSEKKLREILVNIDLRNPKLVLGQECLSLDKVLADSNIRGEQAELFKSILLVISSAGSAKVELLGILKGSKKSADLSATLLVDVDTRYELLLSHAEWLLANCDNALEFDLKLRSGARLSEEFFSDLVFRISKAQRSLLTELGTDDDKLKASSLPTLIRNLNAVNDYLSELLGSLPKRYDLLVSGLF